MAGTGEEGVRTLSLLNHIRNLIIRDGPTTDTTSIDLNRNTIICGGLPQMRRSLVVDPKPEFSNLPLPATEGPNLLTCNGRQKNCDRGVEARTKTNLISLLI